jgi:hypothetical protein
VLQRSLQLTIVFLAVTCPILGQAAQPPQYFVVCASQPNLPTIYYSGVLQGPAAALAGFRAGFNEFLEQRYAYKGVVGCSPSNNALNAQNLITNQSTALRKAKKNVVETGWGGNAATLASVLGNLQGSAAPPATTTKQAQTTAASA